MPTSGCRLWLKTNNDYRLPCLNFKHLFSLMKSCDAPPYCICSGRKNTMEENRSWGVDIHQVPQNDCKYGHVRSIFLQTARNFELGKVHQNPARKVHIPERSSSGHSPGPTHRSCTWTHFVAGFMDKGAMNRHPMFVGGPWHLAFKHTYSLTH